MLLSLSPSPRKLLKHGGSELYGGRAANPLPQLSAFRAALAESAITDPSEQETHSSAFSSRLLMCLEVIV